MQKVILLIFLIMSSVSFSQQKPEDTLFNKKLNEVTVTTVQKKSSEVAVINTVRNLSQVSDAISSDFIKKTPDRTVADALKRVNGVTIQNDKWVLVRGLADRYNLALLNQTLLPSTEPDRRAFSFDILPTGIIDNIIVYKSSSPNLPGDFSGGLIQVSTREVTDNFFTISLGTGAGTLTTGNEFKSSQAFKFPNTFPSTYKYRTSSYGDKRLYSLELGNSLSQKMKAFPNLNGNISFGVKKGKWNMIFSSTARDSWSISYVDRKDYQSSTELAYVYKDTIFVKRFSTSGLLNVTYLNGKNRLSWKTIGNYQKEDLSLFRTGDNWDNLQRVRSSSTNHLETTVINSQIEGKFNYLDFNLGYNYLYRNQPDYRVNPLTKSLGTEEPYQVAWRDTYRFWSIMDEHSANLSVNRKIGVVKVGGGYVKKWRTFNARVFRSFDNTILDEITNNTDKYGAEFDLVNSYLLYDKQIGNWKVNGGLRTEYNLFEVSTSDFNGQNIKVDRKYLDLLPSLNLSYNLEKTKWRISTSKTIARPEFREVANFAYYDFVRNAQILGNSKLEKSDIYNLDLKWETYPKNGENISVGVFGKRFIKPIEQIVADGSVPSNLLLTFTNPNSATLYGVEMEWRKKITTWLDFYTNAALMTSQVKVNQTKRQLQGQSNWLVNTGLNIKKDKNTFNLTYNRVGDRISAVGFQGYPDIFENSRDVIDITYLRKLKNCDLKIAIGDLLSQPSIYYQKPGNRELIRTRNEATVSVSINMTL